ncbi:MAG: hypothetical protein M1830_005407 [Pleopsidium flavum]|nr:MAG: hypothetical protein M1830_005407 [Pleopsidium flavum]
MELVKPTEGPIRSTRSREHDSPPSLDPVADLWPTTTTNAPRPGIGVYAVGTWIAPEHRGSQACRAHLLEGRDVESGEVSRSAEDNQNGIATRLDEPSNGEDLNAEDRDLGTNRIDSYTPFDTAWTLTTSNETVNDGETDQEVHNYVNNAAVSEAGERPLENEALRSPSRDAAIIAKGGSKAEYRIPREPFPWSTHRGFRHDEARRALEKIEHYQLSKDSPDRESG